MQGFSLNPNHAFKLLVEAAASSAERLRAQSWTKAENRVVLAQGNLGYFLSLKAEWTNSAPQSLTMSAVTPRF